MKSTKQTMILIFIMFALLQTVFFLNVDTLEYDEAIYMDIARNVRLTGVATRSIGNGVLHADHPTLYQHLLGLTTFITGENIVILRLITVLGAFLCLFFTYQIVWLATRSWQNSFIATVLLCLNPFFNIYAYFIREEMFMCLFLLMSSYAFWGYEQSNNRRSLWLATCLLACAILTKEFALLFGAVLGIYILLGSSAWLQKIKDLFVLALPSSIGLSLWVAWIWWHDPQRLDIVLDRWVGSAIGGQTDFRLTIATLDWWRIIRDDVLTYGLMVTFILCFLIAIWQRNKPPRFVLLTTGYFLLAIGVSFVIALKEPRHIMAAIPFAAISTGLLPNLAQFDPLGRKGWVRKGIAVVFIVAILLTGSLWRVPAGPNQPFAWWKTRVAARLFYEETYYHIVREAGVYLNTHTPPAAKIAVVHQGTVVGYYANRSYFLLYTMSADMVYATLNKSDYLVYDEPLFLHLSPDEIEQVEAYIAEQFEVVETVVDAYRTVQIYARR